MAIFISLFSVLLGTMYLRMQRQTEPNRRWYIPPWGRWATYGRGARLAGGLFIASGIGIMLGWVLHLWK